MSDSSPAINSDRNKKSDLTERRIQVFKKRHEEAFELACYAAFPLTITSDLLYCLRENFVQDCPWYSVGQILLSGLCETIGYDLYEMEAETRERLIEELAKYKDYSRSQLVNFMASYILNRFNQDTNSYRQEWISLSYLMPTSPNVNEIKQKLQKFLESPQYHEESVKWKALEEKYLDLLREEGFEPLLLKDPESKPLPKIDSDEEKIAAAISIKLKAFEYDVTFICPIFDFEVLTVNSQGSVVDKTKNQATYYLEYLGEVPGEPAELAIEMVAIPGGTFTMGSPKYEKDSSYRERPQHQVKISPFFMGKYPVTQAQWRAIAGRIKLKQKIDLTPDPSMFKGDDLPVERVSWYEAVEFCQRLSKLTGREYRLPSEAEWEYACRAGTTTPFHFGETMTTDLANYDGSKTYQEEPSGKLISQTTPVCQFFPNAFGLYDMHGNVWEWCEDDYHGNYERAPEDGRAWIDDGDNNTSKILRGGSWFFNPRVCRSATRSDFVPDYSLNYIGFRVAVGLAART